MQYPRRRPPQSLSWPLRVARRILFAALPILAGCDSPGVRPDAGSAGSSMPAADAVVRGLTLDAPQRAAVLALDPDNVSAEQVQRVLARAPAPQVLAIYGGVHPARDVMNSFGEFLVAMGYPAERVRNPLDQGYVYSGYLPSEELVGYIAWYYEHDGLRPVLVGHSLGGMQAVKVLHELAGAFGETRSVWNPTSGLRERRQQIRDPLDGSLRPVVGLGVAHTAVVATGGLARLFPQQWALFGRLRSVPQTSASFTAYHLGFDPIGGDLFGLDTAGPFVAESPAVRVRMVELPPGNNHFLVPDVRHLARDPATRAWIDAYRPEGRDIAGDPLLQAYPRLLWAADVWFSIKRHWVLELQGLLDAAATER